MRHFNVYKGLQKPLVFKGFKGRYIYWGLGFIVASLIVGGLIGAFFSLLAGVFAMVIVMVGGIFYTSQRQRDGLHDKARDSNVVYMLQTELKGIRHVKKKERI